MSTSVLYASSEEASKASSDLGVGNLLNKIGGYTRYMPYSKVDNQAGKVGILEAGAEGSREFQIFGKLPLTISAGVDYINIDKTVRVPLPVSLVNVGVGLEGKVPLFNIKGAYIGASINPSFAADRYSFGTDSFYLPTRLFGVYTPNDKLIIIAGAEFFTDFDNDVQPIGGIIYKPTDKLTFNLITDDPYILYKINDKLDIRAEGGYHFWNQYKVRRQGNNNVLFEYQDVWVGGGFNFKPIKSINIFMTVGGVFDRNLKYPDAGGKVDIDKGYYLQGAIEISF